MSDIIVTPASLADPLSTAIATSTLYRTMLFDVPLTLFAESLHFAGRRIHSHGDLLMAMAQSASPTDFLAAQARFAQAAIEDYSGGALRLAEVLPAASGVQFS